MNDTNNYRAAPYVQRWDERLMRTPAAKRYDPELISLAKDAEISALRLALVQSNARAYAASMDESPPPSDGLSEKWVGEAWASVQRLTGTESDRLRGFAFLVLNRFGDFAGTRAAIRAEYERRRNCTKATAAQPGE